MNLAAPAGGCLPERGAKKDGSLGTSIIFGSTGSLRGGGVKLRLKVSCSVICPVVVVNSLVRSFL